VAVVESNVESGNRDGICIMVMVQSLRSRSQRGYGVPRTTIYSALFEGLAVKNPKTLEPEPGVAERWDISDDGTVYTFI
jgi:oligopeptide transport system substrate-binding protein